MRAALHAEEILPTGQLSMFGVRQLCRLGGRAPAWLGFFILLFPPAASIGATARRSARKSPEHEQALAAVERVRRRFELQNPGHNGGALVISSVPAKTKLLATFILSLAFIAQARGAQARTDPNTGLEEVLVTGEHPGPGLWKVSKGEHVLWVLGTHSPLPQRLLWRSEEVELVMTEAQQVIGNYSATFTFQGANPLQTKGKSLRSLLKRKDYVEWQKLKKLYIGPNKEIDNAWPVTAALVLRSSAFERAGLISGDSVWREIYRLANAYNVPVTTQHQVNKTVASIAPGDRDAERRGVAYLVNTMASLETDLSNARARANAWAIGNVDALRKQAEADRTAADLYANSWPFFSAEEMRDLSEETDARWLEAATRALNKNTTTLAVLPIFLILKPDGLMARLEAQGFEVETPTK